ncbi:unnamed protein product [Rotaria socialis]
MASPTRIVPSPTASRIATIIPNTTVISPRSVSTRSQLEESISTLQNEQERVQKKTFTKWVNIYLSLHEPAYYINDLFEDFQDGTKLVALLEVLSGQTLPIERGKKRAHCLSNVDNALKYLESRKIKLVNIRPIDIVDGKPMMILGLIWMLILCYQIEDSSMFDENSKDNRSKAKEALLGWVRKKTSGQIDGLDVRDFTSSWRDGLAFNALIHAIRPDLVDLRRVTRMDIRERLENAFTVAEQQLGVPRLIDAEDVDVNKPDEKSIMTYVAQFSRRFPDLPFGSVNKEHGEFLRWIADIRQRLAIVVDAPIQDIIAEYKEYVKLLKQFIEKQKQWKVFERKESKSPHFPGEKLKELRDAFDDITIRMNRWRCKLDSSLPGELGRIADWINTAEQVLARPLGFDRLKSSPEENIQRFNQLNQEHAAIFNNKESILHSFQCHKRDASVINKQISLEHLTNLNERLDIIMNASEERGRFLDFEELHWKVQKFFEQLEYFIMELNKKQGDSHHTERLYDEFKRKIYEEKLPNCIESLLPELTRRSQSYTQLGKKGCAFFVYDHVAREFHIYCENIRKTLKSFNVDLKAKEHMLQETISGWKVYHNLYASLENWLNEGEHVLRRSSEEKLEFFSNVEHWAQIHDELRLAIERLLSVCDDENSVVLHNKLLFINRRWKEVIESVHQFKHDESIKKKRDEFYAGRAKLLDTLDRIEREMQDYLPCTMKTLKEQENRLYDAQAELDVFNQTVQVLSKLSQTIARESGEANATAEMNSLLQICFDKLQHVQEYLPLTLKRNKIMLGHLQKFDDGIQKCQQWLNEAKQLFSRYSIQVPVKRIEDFLEQHRNFFADMSYYQSLIESKSKLIGTMKKSNENFIPLNFLPVDEQYKQLADTFEQICHQTSYWEKEFTLHSQLWKGFHQRLKRLEEWIDQAQEIVNEKHEDSAYLIQKHKNFFQMVDDEILHGFIKSGQELLHIRDQTEQKDIQFLMDSLESKWNTIICFAPIRLLRLQYERVECIVVKELKQAEDELNDELRLLERQLDTVDILRRHNEHFQLNNFHPTIETHLRNLHSYANDIRSKDKDTTHENEQIDQRTAKLNDYWARMQAKIDNVRRKLQTIPKKWQEFEEKFHLVETWMATMERSMSDTMNTEVSFDQYKLIVNKFKNDVQQIDTIAYDVKTLSTLLDELIEERATSEPARYRQRLDALITRYKQLLSAIDETSQRCTIIIPAKMIHENSLQLNASLINISNAPINFRDLSDVRTTVQGQIRVCDVLDGFSHQVNELVTRGNELMRQPMVPKYVQQDVQGVQKLYNEKVQSARDYLEKLKRLLEFWERFDANTRRYQQQTERLNTELAQLRGNLHTITSFQHEIENCKYLRSSYVDLKLILDENAQYLQSMTSNNLLPYEILQKLKIEYDNMIEELNEKLRLIDEILQDLIADNTRWIRFNDESKRLDTLFREIGSMFDAKMFGERPLEEKQQILERLRSELGEHLHSLSILYSDGSNLESLRTRPKDLQNALSRLAQLRALAEAASGKVNREEEQVAECRTHVQTTHRYIQQFQPWVDSAEYYLTKRLDQSGALNLTEAKQLHDKHKEFLEERRRMALIHTNLVEEERNVADQYELKALIKSLSLRWLEVVRKSDELTPRYDKQYSSWLLFESELNSFRDQILEELERRVNSMVTIDVNKLIDLARINALLNELRALDENIHNHTSNYNRFNKQLSDLRQYTSTEGQRILHEEQMSVETRWNQINRLTSDKLRETERLYESRKSFHNRFEVFERTAREIVEQIEGSGQIQTSTWNQTFLRLQQTQKQLETIQPLISTIGKELINFELSGLSKADSQTIQNAFDAHRQRINTIEIILQKRLNLLQRYEEHINCSMEIRKKLQKINEEIQQRQQMKLTDIDLMRTEFDRYTNDLRSIQSESSLLDRLMEESNTTLTDSTTNRNIFFLVEYRTIQNLVDSIDNKLFQRRVQAQELERLLDDFGQAHTNLLHRINALSTNLRTARLIGYSTRDIEDIMSIVKTLNREIQNEGTNLNLLRTKYKTFSSDLSSQERQQAEIAMTKIQVELEQVKEQAEKRYERLNTLIQQRQELDQTYDRFMIWYKDKQRLIPTDTTIPLKTIEVERLLKKYTDALNETKSQRITLENILKLNESVKQGYYYEDKIEYNLHTHELAYKLNHLEEALNDRLRQLNVANEQRLEIDRIMTKLNESIKTTEQQIKDPFANDLQQPTNVLKDKSKTMQSLLQATRERINEFEELTRIHNLVASTLNDSERITLNEKYTLLKEKYSRLLDSLTQRIASLDEAIRERTEFEQENDQFQIFYQKLQNEFAKEKQQKLTDMNYPSNERRLEQYKKLLKHLDETMNHFKELTRIQRLLTNKGHRIDFRSAGELNANLKTLEGQIHNEIERIERALQTENEFYNIDRELDSYLHISAEQLKSSQHHQDKDAAFQTIANRLQQSEHELNKSIQLSERLVNDLPRSKYEQLKRTIENRHERLQALKKTCEKARGEHEHMIKTQNKLNEDLITIIDWFRKVIQDLNQPFELNLSLNNVADLQDSVNQLDASVDQRLIRIDQALHDEPNLVNSNDVEIRQRLKLLEELKHQVKALLNKQRIILNDIHQGITHYIKLTTDVKAVICDADFKLAPFFDGYDRKRLDEHEKELNFLETLCAEQKHRLIEAHKVAETFRLHLRANAREICDSQLKNFEQTIEDLEIRIRQRRKEVEEIRQKSDRFNSSMVDIQSSTNRLLDLIEKSPDHAENLLTDMDSTFTALQYLGRDLKKSLDVSSSTEIDRELKDIASSVETVRDSLDRARRNQEENESVRDRIERTLNNIKSFLNRKRQEIRQVIDTGYTNVDVVRRTVEMKNFMRDLELENAHISEIKECLSVLLEKKCDPKIITVLENQHQEVSNDLQSLQNEIVNILENFDRQVQEQERLRQNARIILSIIQRTKIQLIELYPTVTDEANRKLEIIDEDLSKNFQLFDQSLDDYKNTYGNISDDLEKIIIRVYEEIDDIKLRINEKKAQLNDLNLLRDEYESSIENITKVLLVIEAKTQKTNIALNLDALKDLTVEMQAHRPSIDRVQLLSSTLISHLIDSHEREHIRRRLNEIVRQWTEIEQILINEEEDIVEMNHILLEYRNSYALCEHWLKQAKELIYELTNAKTIETLNQLMPKARTVLTEYQSNLQHLDRLKNKLIRIVQTSQMPEATLKLNELDRLLADLIVHHEKLDQCLNLSYKVHFQLSEFSKQQVFYEQWINNIQRTVETVFEEKLTIDEKLQCLNDIKFELDKRKQILNNSTNDYPEIDQLIIKSIQKLVEQIEKIKATINQKQEEYEQQNRQHKDFRDGIEMLFEWIKQSYSYESLNDKRDLESLERELKKINDKQQHIIDKSKEIDALARAINNSKLPNDTLQKLRQEIDHLVERFTESNNELETRSIFIKKTMRDVDEHQRKQRRYQESLDKLSSLVEHDLQIPGRSVEDALSSLGEHVLKTEEYERRKRQYEREWHLYIEEIYLLQEKLNKLKERKGNFYDSLEEQLSFIRNQLQELNRYQDELTNLKKHGQNICLDNGNIIALPSEIHQLQSIINLLKQQFDQRREVLIENQRNRDMYLNECKLYEHSYNLSMERLSRSITFPSTVDEFNHQLNEHKLSNEQIDEKRRRLNFLFDKLDRETRSRYSKQYYDLEKRSNDLQDKMIQQTIRLEYFLRTWKEYQLRFRDIYQQLRYIEEQLPSNKHLVLFQQIQTTFLLYKDLKQRLILIEPELLHLNDEIQTFSRQLNIISLQIDIQNVNENFIRVSTDIKEKFQCHKTATVVANDIRRNLSILEDTLGQCSIESQAQYDGDIAQLKIQLEKMMDVEKRLENIADVYSNTATFIKRLKTFNLYELQSIESNLESFHHKWTSLKADILRNENILHQNITSRLPSRQASKEMSVFIDTIKRLLDDDHGAPINNKETLQKLIKRYRDMRVDVLNHQRTIDFLNESLQQEANVDLTSIDHMENIKKLNIDWIRIKSLISARIETLEQLNEQFNEFDQTVRTLSDWVQEQTSDLEFMRARSLEAGVKDNIRRCNEIEFQLASKQQVLTSLKSFSGRMISNASTFRIIDQDGTLQNLRHMLDQLFPSIEQLKLKSKSILTDWQEYNRVLLQMDKILLEAEVEIDRIEISAMNVETYEMSTRKAQEYLQSMESHRHDFDQIIVHDRHLSGQCDGQTSSKINEITARIEQRWIKVQHRLHEIIKPSREVVDNWRQFNTLYVHLLDRLGELEGRWYTIQQEKFTADIDSLFEKAKDFQQRLEQLDLEVLKLHEYTKKLTHPLPPIAAKKIDTQYSVIKNQHAELENLQKKLLIDCNELKYHEKVYLDYFHELNQIIHQVQTTLKTQKLTDEYETVNLKQVQELDTLLESKRILIERLNSNEFNLYIKRKKNFQELLIEYSNCIDSVKKRLKQIELNEYNKLNFEKRCQKWNAYIQAIEQNLSVVQENIHTNYHGLVEIDKNLSTTIDDFSQRQQELVNLINEGKDVIENKHIFIKLEQRWKNIMNTMLNKQKEIKELIKLWLAYQNYIESYHRLLKDKCDAEQKELQAATINIINQMKQGSLKTNVDNDELRSLLEKIYDINRTLIRNSDAKAQVILEKELNDLQKSIHQVDSTIKQKRETLYTLLLRYNELDRILDELSTIVKSIRSLQQQSTEDFDQFLIQCQNKNRELTQHRTELQRARQAITEISPELHPEDSRQLIQKLNLLEIQWTDAERSLATLIDTLAKRRTEYQDFENKFLRFVQWYEHFLNNEISQRLDGLTIESTLEILKNEIKNIVTERRKYANELLIQGRLLQSQTHDPAQLQILRQKVEQLEQMIETVEQQIGKRIKKAENTSKMFHDFEQGFENLCSWMDTIEINLQRASAIQSSNDFHAHQQPISAIEMDIESHSTTLNSLLALGHNLLSETEMSPRSLESLSRTVKTLEQRWGLLKELIMKRKSESDSIHVTWRNLDESISRASKMISDHERFLAEVKRTSGEGLQGIRNEYKSLESVKKTLVDDDKQIQQINKNYSDILHRYSISDSSDDMRIRIKDLNNRWEILNGTFSETIKNLKYMLSVHGDFQLTHDSLVLWLTDLDVLLTNLEHLSEASTNEKIRQLDDMDREIHEKQTKIEYVQTCANYLLSKTVDARGLTINMNQLTKFCQQLRALTKRIIKLKKNLMNVTDHNVDYTSSARSSPLRFASSPTRKRVASPSPPRSRSPNRYLRSRDRFIRPMDKIDLGDNRQHADKLLADFEDILLQINADFHSKEENLHTPTPTGVQIENLPTDFTYNRILTSIRRKIDTLNQFIHQIKQELGAYVIQDFNNDPMVVDIMNKWSHIQSLTNEKDDQLNQNRQRWKLFKRQLENLELLSEQFTSSEHSLSRSMHSKADVKERLDEIEVLLRSTIELSHEFNDNSNIWILFEHRLQLIKDKFQYSHTRSSSPTRESKINSDTKNELLEINSQVDHLETLAHSLEPIDNNEMNQNINRTKLHHFIRIHDDLEILNERLININKNSLSIVSSDQMRQINDMKLIFDRLNSIKRIVKLHLDQLEKLLARNELNLSQMRSSNNNFQRLYQ